MSGSVSMSWCAPTPLCHKREVRQSEKAGLFRSMV